MRLCACGCGHALKDIHGNKPRYLRAHYQQSEAGRAEAAVHGRKGGQAGRGAAKVRGKRVGYAEGWSAAIGERRTA